MRQGFLGGWGGGSGQTSPSPQKTWVVAWLPLDAGCLPTMMLSTASYHDGQEAQD